ncbi:MAG TPA: hypothetical protein VFL34_02405 [Candidatus Sulfotelmatobacter sp.]|nr:hypothetical protein [Candidatus Sulfotelmatobacter sp.]
MPRMKAVPSFRSGGWVTFHDGYVSPPARESDMRTLQATIRKPAQGVDS